MSCTLIPFAQRLLPAPRTPAFAHDDWWTWCGSVVRGDDGAHHLFASRWPRSLPFFNGYLTHSRIIYAVAPDPLGPFRFVDDVLPPTREPRWDNRMTHNPAIVRFADAWWLFYIGLHDREPTPDLAAPFERWLPVYRGIRIGVARADRLEGPWVRCQRPIIDTDVAPWPHLVTTNPAPVITPQGRVRVYYRTPRPAGAGQFPNVLAVAEAEHPLGPYRCLVDEPLLPPQHHLEDPYVWWNGWCYEMLAKDLSGQTTCQVRATAHLRSEDGIRWQLAEHPAAYRRDVRFEDGRTIELGNLERPWLIHEGGQPAVLYAAAGDDPRGFHHNRRTWLQAIPLQKKPGSP